MPASLGMHAFAPCRRPGQRPGDQGVAAGALAIALARAGVGAATGARWWPLQELDAHVLKDIGIERLEIQSVVCGAGSDAWRVERA